MTIPTHAHPPVQFDRQSGAYLLNRKAFVEAYTEEVVDAVAVSEGSNPPVSNLETRQKIDRSFLAGQALETTYTVARQLLGPVQALALAGTAMTRLVGPQQVEDLDQGMRHRMKARLVGPVEGSGSQLYLGDQQETGFGASTSRSVILPEGFAPLLPHPLGAFLVGHELGHVENQDVIKRFGRLQVVSALSPGELASEAQQTFVQMDHEIEFAADQRGLNYATQRGHSREAVLEGFAKFLKLTGNGESSDSHPSSQARLRRLQPGQAEAASASGQTAEVPHSM